MTNILAMQHVTYTVDHQTIIPDLNLSVPTGAWLTIAGPSGSGKSTLLRLLATLLTPTSGTITFNGQPQHTLARPDYRRLVSYCFQQPTLFGDTVEDNLRFPFALRDAEFDPTRATQALASVDLPENFLTKPLTALSGGEKQRVALIRNLLFPPQVLLLDEVTTGLDADTKALVHQLIQTQHENGVTIVAVTHDETELAAATNVVTLIAGRLLEAEHD